MERKIISKEDKIKIINRYETEIISIDVLAKEYGVGKLKIKSILSEYGVEIRKRGGQIVTGDSFDIEKSKIKKYKAASGRSLVAICKKTNKRYNDINNLSGYLTEHIINEYGDVPIPQNTYQRKKYEIQFGKKWFEDYFDIVEVDVRETKSCPYCDWETVDVENKSGVFQQHLFTTHNKTIGEYLIEYPNDCDYFSKYTNNLKKHTTDNHVICQVCGRKFVTISETHLKKHGITVLEYKLRFPDSPIISKKYRDNLIERYETNLKLHEKTFTTKPQKEIAEFIESLGFKVKLNDKKLLSGVEIDILIEEMSLGIEYNGLFYHTEVNGKHRQFHLSKTKLMNGVGYGLIHIFEDEWLNSKLLIKNKLKHILGVNNSIVIGARRCVVKEIPTQLKNVFLNSNHIQGTDNSDICFGAYYGDKLLSVMSFSNKQFMSKNRGFDKFELTRFATHIDYRVVGIGGKLLNYFIKTHNPSSIISFGDVRWVLNSNNNLYTKLGFNFVGSLSPDYCYYNPKIARNKRFHKFGFGKTNLKKRYPDLDFSKTEKELTSDLGYNRIWNCGLFKYEYLVES
jgi:hypothetical protein